MWLTRIISVGWLAFLLVSLQSFGQNTEDLEASLSLEQTSIPLHALIKAALQIHNAGDEYTYAILLGSDDKHAFTLRVQEPSGAIGTYKIPEEEGLHSPGVHRIKPGETYKKELILNDWYKFPSTGTYHVTLTMQADVGEDMVGRPMKQFQPLRATLNQTITVLAADSGYVLQECRALVAIIRSRSPYDVILKAADGLTLINDPIAAPYLMEAAEAKPAIAYRFISALQSLGTKDAIEDLIKLAVNSNLDTRASARSALLGLEMTTSDNSIREQVRSALAALPKS